MIEENDILRALNFVQNNIKLIPKIGLVLGSGLGDFGTRVKSLSTIHASEIPGYPRSSVQGHSEKLIFGYLQKGTTRSLPLVVFQGRIHYYETESIEQVIFPIILAYKLGVRKLILTNAAGGINNRFSVGDLMIINDVIQLAFLAIPPSTRGSFFPKKKYDSIFDKRMQAITLQCAVENGISLNQGTYCWLKGPSYETAAEIRMLKRLGADAVGMSTVPEVIAAKRLGMKTVGISLISNLAAGISTTKLTHSEVTQIAHQVKDTFTALMSNLIFSLK